MNDNERLVSLETKLEFLKALLLEVRDDIKGLPTKEEYDKLEIRVRDLELARTRDAIKIGVASGLAGIIAGLILKFFI